VSEIAAVRIDGVTHRYGPTTALQELSLTVPRGCIFGLLGPNGSGKSTLFRLVSTLVPIQEGTIEVFGRDVRRDRNGVRGLIGVVFQSPSLDRKLTVRENMQCQAALYGLHGQQQKDRIEELSQWLGIADRLGERSERLSGGLKRRAELAKGLMHRPSLLILDEPSTGLDPSARLELWKALSNLRDGGNTTVVMTTHLLEEADKCDRLAILNAGQLVADDTPENLRRETGETRISISSREPQRVASVLASRFHWSPQTFGEEVRVVIDNAPPRIAEVMQALGDSAMSVTVGRPGLEDVFIRKTGMVFRGE
jgi:ABC-2 type transport system ATP-binding protein